MIDFRTYYFIVFSLLFWLPLKAGDLSFNRDIRPILSDKCFSCHGPGGKPKGKLRLDKRDHAIDVNRKNGPGIIPGKAEQSPFIHRILSLDADEVMPPPESHKVLSKQEKMILSRWINEGAKYEKHWSFLPIKGVKAISSNSNKLSLKIDELVKERLMEYKLNLNERADSRILLRRLYLDLIGLPPSLEQLDAYLSDSSKNAYEKVVDQLLLSKHFGEYIARYWLDVVRYGDTHGIHADNYREMYAYRDWVIRAFNANQPFNDFASDQIAGDLQSNPSRSQLIASGFNRLHISNSAGSALEDELYVNNVKDRVNSFSTIFLGLTFECAACHDHKYDEISQKEYYQLYAYFNSMDGPPDNKGVKNPKPFLYLSPASEKVQSLKNDINLAKSKKEKQALRKKLKKLHEQRKTTLIMKELEKPKPAYILHRGEYDQPGKRVYRDTPATLPAMKSDLPNNRLGLAKWLFDDEHPLTARVIVNRIWQQFFGVGIVKTSEDLGSQGEWPSHPKLLDQLAYSFIESNWDMKQLIKSIVMSEVYQQSSHAQPLSYKNDPGNRLLSRGPRFRLDAEVLRDQALWISGLLNPDMYGPSIKVPQPKGLWDAVAVRGSNTRYFVADQGQQILRRSLYMFWKRAFPPPSMSIFNAPNREQCVVKRERTNTPLQALVLMNEEQFFGASKHLAELSLQKNLNDRQRLLWLYEKITSRRSDEQRTTMMLDSLNHLKKHHSNNEVMAYTMIVNSLFNLDYVKNKN